MHKPINKYDYFLMCILFYSSFIRLYVCAFAILPMVHCGSAFEPGASGLPYSCTRHASCVDSKPKKKIVPVRLTGHKYLRNKLSNRDVSSCRFVL